MTALLVALGMAFPATARAKNKPLLRDFMGLNGHYHFKPELYQKNCRLVRNYHSMNWDVAKPGDEPTFPVCVNKVNWDKVYGKWAQHGFETDLCVMFARFGESNPDYRQLWQGHEQWAFTYGKGLAEQFGPTRGNGMVSSIEIGNEPGNDFDDDDQASVHAASGLTRNFKPKMSYWAVSHLYQQLGEFRFSRVVETSEEKFIYEFVHRDGSQRAWVCWMPVDAMQQKQFEIALPFDPGRIERMPTATAAGVVVDFNANGRTITLPMSGSPVYVFSK